MNTNQRFQNVRNLSDPRDRLHDLLSDLADTGISHFLTWLQRPTRTMAAAEAFDFSSSDDDDDDDDDTEDREDAVSAASLLGIAVDASTDEIRAAFRRRVKAELGTGDFHDQGGPETDTRAQQLIAAKNLLIERNHVAGS